MHSPKCLFSSLCEAAAFRRISIFTKTPPSSGGGMSGRQRGATERRAGVTGGGVQRAGGGRRSLCRSSGELWWSSR